MGSQALQNHTDQTDRKRKLAEKRQRDALMMEQERLQRAQKQGELCTVCRKNFAADNICEDCFNKQIPKH